MGCEARRRHELLCPESHDWSAAEAQKSGQVNRAGCAVGKILALTGHATRDVFQWRRKPNPEADIRAGSDRASHWWVWIVFVDFGLEAH